MLKKAMAFCIVLVLVSSSNIGSTSSNAIIDLPISSSENEKDSIEQKNNVTFNEEDVRENSNVSKEQLQSVLYLTELGDIASDIIDAEEKYSINSLFLTALIAHESAWGESNRSKNNNLTGYAVYNSFSKGASFSSKRENIFKTAELLAEDFLNPSGRNFNGFSVVDVNKKYCFKQDQKTIDFNWSKSITSIANDLGDKIMEGDKIEILD